MGHPERGRHLLELARQHGYGVTAGGVAHGAHDGLGATTVRTATHQGHEIRIETTYSVTIDGRPLDGPLEVLDNGLVHYHGLPQYAVPSAIDLLRLVIDHFGTDPPTEDELAGLEHDDREHDHGQHDDGGHQ